jgi:hypothetical protein
MYKAHQDDPRWLCVHFSSHTNPYISDEGLAEVTHDMTRLAYLQEIEAQDTEEVPGALWTRDLIERTRVYPQHMPELRRIVVGIDPSGSTTTEVGIVAAGEANDGQIYIFRDESMVAPKPRSWAEKAVALFKNVQADRLLGERNYGGDMVEETIRHVDENVSYKDCNATRGKIVRAEPVCALFEQNRCHIVGEHVLLEDEMCSYVPGGKSPNRMDAMVWCVIELTGSGALGLVELLKAKAAVKPGDPMGRRPMAMTPVPTDLHAVAIAEETPKCPNCAAISLGVIAGGQLRCQACGYQWWRTEKDKPATGGARRAITLEK